MKVRTPLTSRIHCIHRAAILAAALGVSIIGKANAADLALTHARIYAAPDAEPIADGTILIHDGQIVSVAEGGALRVPRDVARAFRTKRSAI